MPDWSCQWGRELWNCKLKLRCAHIILVTPEVPSASGCPELHLGSGFFELTGDQAFNPTQHPGCLFLPFFPGLARDKKQEEAPVIASKNYKEAWHASKEEYFKGMFLKDLSTKMPLKQENLFKTWQFSQRRCFFQLLVASFHLFCLCIKVSGILCAEKQIVKMKEGHNLFRMPLCLVGWLVGFGHFVQLWPQCCKPAKTRQENLSKKKLKTLSFTCHSMVQWPLQWNARVFYVMC